MLQVTEGKAIGRWRYYFYYLLYLKLSKLIFISLRRSPAIAVESSIPSTLIRAISSSSSDPLPSQMALPPSSSATADNPPLSATPPARTANNPSPSSSATPSQALTVNNPPPSSSKKDAKISLLQSIKSSLDAYTVLNESSEKKAVRSALTACLSAYSTSTPFEALLNDRLLQKVFGTTINEPLIKAVCTISYSNSPLSNDLFTKANVYAAISASKADGDPFRHIFLCALSKQVCIYVPIIYYKLLTIWLYHM